jgi:hypothetical protein
MSKHTPGPWSGSEKFCVGPISRDDDQSYGMVISLADVYGPNRDADSHLIAAAPELLEALLVVMSYPVVRNCLEVEHNDAARAAIAKATGEKA